MRFVAQVIGNIVDSFPAVPLGPLLLRALETDKIVGPKRHRQNYDAEIKWSNEAWSELLGRKHNIKNSFQDLVTATPNITISFRCWWKSLGHNRTADKPFGGHWAEHERMHINVLKLKGVFIGIRTYCHNKSYKHVRVMSRSSTAIAYIYNKGIIKSKKCNEIAKEIWLWCFKNYYFISTAHIPGNTSPK